MQTAADYQGMNAGVRRELHYGMLIIGLFTIALMCLLAWFVSSAQMPATMVPVHLPPVI
jgi:hypothetical protein